MRSLIKFWDITDTYYTIDLPTPQYPYTVDIHMPIYVSKAGDNSYSDNCFFDCPDENVPPNYGTFDYRLLKIDNWLLNDTQQTSLNGFFRDIDKGRGLNCKLKMGATGIGFFVAGPDYADFGNYTLRLLSHKQTGVLQSPFQCFKNEVIFLITSFSAEIPIVTYRNQGPLQIGAVDGLMLPLQNIDAQIKYNVLNEYSMNGTPYSEIQHISSDSFETNFELECNTGNAYALVNQFEVTTRTNDLDIIIPSGNFLFGNDNWSGGTYTCKFLGSTIEDTEIVLSLQHVGFEQWKIPLSFWLKEKIA
jgi:hypothetical protein